MDYKRKKKNEKSHCLECGGHLDYGRADRKFCSDQCRYKFNNEQLKDSRAYKRRLMNTLTNNYSILDKLLKADVASIDLVEAMNLGFVPGIVTSYHKVRGHDEFSCFDIKFIMTSSRIFGITKISLNLQVTASGKRE